MADDLTAAELGRSLDRFSSALDRVSERLDRVSERLDKLPDSIDRLYVRKDVMMERNKRVDGSLAELAHSDSQIQEQFERLFAAVRWTIAAVLVPVVLAIFALLSAHGGLG